MKARKTETQDQHRYFLDDYPDEASIRMSEDQNVKDSMGLGLQGVEAGDEAMESPKEQKSERHSERNTKKFGKTVKIKSDQDEAMS